MQRLKGILLIVVGAALWGATGPMMEWLLDETALTVSFILALRLIIAGIVLLIFLSFKMDKSINSIWQQRIWLQQLFIFSLVGMLGLQYSFAVTIKVSNAIVATLLQFLAPIFIVLYVSLSQKKWPPRFQVIGIISTLAGLFLLLTNASFDHLLVSKEALVWGIILGLSFSFYTLYPARLMKEWGVLLVVAWGMLISGVLLGVSTAIWRSSEWLLLKDGKIIMILLLLTLFSTLAYVMFLSSMSYITPIETSVLSSIEPLTTMVISIIVFQATLGIWQVLGIVVMLLSVMALSLLGDKA